MTLTVTIKPTVTGLLRAVGLVDADGHISAAWFQDPLGAIRRVMADPVQRAALLELLDELLDQAPNAPAGSTWHPLLEPNGRGNVHIAVRGTKVGVAATYGTDTGVTPAARLRVELPFVEAAGGDVRPIAGTADGPLELSLDLSLGTGAPATALHVEATVDLAGDGELRLVLDGVQVGSISRTLSISTASAGRDLAIALETLVRDATARFVGDATADHLLGALGLDPTRPMLPVDRLLSDPEALRTWLASLAATPADLHGWFADLAGLLGGAAPASSLPLRSRLVDFGGGAQLAMTGAAVAGELRLGLAMTVRDGGRSLEAEATLIAIPLTPGPAVQPVPDAALRVVVTGTSGDLVPVASGFGLGAIRAGIGLDATGLHPELLATGATLNGQLHPSVDLTDATAVSAAVTSTLQLAIKEALGSADPGQALLALLGILPPRTDTTTPHVVTAAALGAGPTRAIAGVHRAILGDPTHPWSHMLAELGQLLGLGSGVSGSGTAAAPWAIELGSDGGVRVDLAAWDAREPGDPAGDHRLRLGLLVTATSGDWSARLLGELLSFDLPATTSGPVGVIGRQHAALTLDPVPEITTADGLELTADAVVVEASWTPGLPLTTGVRVDGVRLAAAGATAGPLTLRLPPSGPAAGADFGLGADPQVLWPALRLVALHALQAWGGDGARAIGSLLGLDDALGALEPPNPADLRSLLDDPGALLRKRLHDLLLSVDPATGEAAPERLLQAIAAAVRNQVPAAGDSGLDMPIDGTGTYADPWALAIEDDQQLELVAWLDPAGPPPGWATPLSARVRGAADAATLLAYVPRSGAFLPELPAWPAASRHADALTALASWLSAGDGVAPLAAQLPGLAGWRDQVVAPCQHAALPRHPDVIAAIAAQVQAWEIEDGDASPVFLMGPTWASATAWADLLAAAEPGRPAGAHFDLRADTDPAAVSTVATHYTAEIPGDPQAQATAAIPAVERVATLSGGSRVILVAHSTAGLAARALAAARPDLVRAIITLATPHDGALPAPLADDELADAVRLARDLGGSALDLRTAAVLTALDGALDGVAGAVRREDFVTVDSGATPGLAIGSALGGDLIDAVKHALADRLAAVAMATAPRPKPTHLGVGLRAALPLDITDTGDLVVDARARLDAARIRLPLAASEPSRPARAVDIAIELVRPGGWLAGSAAADGARIRSALVGATLVPTPAGGLDATARLELRDSSLDTATARRQIDLDDPELGAALEAVADALGLSGARPQLDELHELATAPAAALRARRDAFLDALGGPLVIAVGGTDVELSIDRTTWELRVQTLTDLSLGDGAGLGIDCRVALLGGGGMHLDATLSVGALRLTHSSTDGRLTLAAPPWLDPLTLDPDPGSAALRGALGPMVARASSSTVLSAVLSGLLETPGTVGPLDRLLADPGATLTQLDGADLHELLRAAARAIGLDDTAGLPLPGGLLLSASGIDPLVVELTGTLDLGQTGDTLAIAIGLEIAADRTVAVAAEITLDVDLSSASDWKHVEIAFALSAGGLVTLIVTPQGARPITLLPQFSGFGDLVAAGAASLLPDLLQALTDETAPHGAFGQAVLAVAAALGVYDAAGSGFTGSSEVAELRAMLQPGWLEAHVTDTATLATAIAALFGPNKIALPNQHAIVAAGGLVTYTAPLPGTTGGTLTVQARVGAPPTIRVRVSALDAGPLVVEEARVGFDGDIDLALTLRLDPDGELAFLQPRMELAVEAGELSLVVLPLGVSQRNELAVDLAPAPAVVATVPGLLALLAEWGAPLATLLGLRAIGTTPLTTPLWTAGPTLGAVLSGAGLTQGANSTQLALPFPPLERVALGALNALATGISVQLPSGVSIGLVTEPSTSRKGVRLKGRWAIAVEDGPDVDLRYGKAAWLDDPDAGVTLWALRPVSGMPPVAIDPGLDIIGLGVVLGNGASDPLIDGPVKVGKLGGLLFARLDFLDAGGQPALSASDLGAALEILAAQIEVSTADGDSFLQKLIPLEMQAPFDVAVEGREGKGIELHGGVGGSGDALELTFPLNLDIAGVVLLRELFLAARRQGAATNVIGAISADASLGPVLVVVRRIGLSVTFGAGDPALGFKFPDGLGLSIDTPGVRAGGFLLIDQERGRYVGAIELVVVEKFSLVGIAIITTKRPDGSEGFALLLLIAITFPVPIPLGYGFFFAGAGGLLGLNRGVDLDRLRLGLRSGTADSILFPTDIVRRIDTIVRDLDEVFPIAQDRFLIAPMAMLTFSTPPLITAKVGLIIEIGSPLRLGLLGVLRLALPDPQTAIVDLKVAFLGAVDIPGAMLSFDASIYDSYIGYADFKLRLEGDMALRISWGQTPDFVVTVGGFHPSFSPGSHLRLPAMRRMSLSLMKDNPRITLSAYFALTSNTVQFGARLELVVRAGDFSVEGHCGFDVLIQIVPFRLEAHVSALLEVKYGGAVLFSISLDLTVVGPAPWIARGRATFTALLIEVTVAFEVTMGKAAPTALPRVAVLPKLLDALQSDGAWSAAMGAGVNELVILRPPAKDDLVLDAAGQLTVQQRLMPLGRDISLFGTARPSDVSRVTVGELRIGTQPSVTHPVTDRFAPAAFRALADKEKLAAPSFERMPAGVQSETGDRLTTDACLLHQVHYETLVFDSVPSPTSGAPPVSVAVVNAGLEGPGAKRFGKLVAGGAIGRSAGSLANARLDEQGKVVDATPVGERYGVVRAGDLVARNAAGGTTFGQDQQRLLSRSDAQARADALNASATPDATFEILPEAQLATA